MARIPNIGRPLPPKTAPKPQEFDLAAHLAAKAEAERHNKAVAFAKWKRENT